MFHKLTPEEQEERKRLRLEKAEQRAELIKRQFSSTMATTSKQLIWIFSINGILWIWCSYILAFMQRDQIAEALSTNVCTVVIGQMAMYLITKTIENVFQYNNFKWTGDTQTHSEPHIQDGVPYGDMNPSAHLGADDGPDSPGTPDPMFAQSPADSADTTNTNPEEVVENGTADQSDDPAATAANFDSANLN